MTCPCKVCSLKGCGAQHDTCERYHTWKKQLDVIRDARIKENEYKSYSHERDIRNRKRFKNIGGTE